MPYTLHSIVDKTESRRLQRKGKAYPRLKLFILNKNHINQFKTVQARNVNDFNLISDLTNLYAAQYTFMVSSLNVLLVLNILHNGHIKITYEGQSWTHYNITINKLLCGTDMRIVGRLLAEAEPYEEEKLSLESCPVIWWTLYHIKIAHAEPIHVS